MRSYTQCRVFLSIMCLCTVLLSRSAFACPADVSPVQVTFVNGIWTWNAAAADASRKKLEDAVKADPRWVTIEDDCVAFAYSYNRLNFYAGDLYQVIIQYFGTNVAAGLRTLAGVLPPSSQFSAAMVDLATEVDISACFASGKDCDRLLSDVKDTAEGGTITLAVAHSQGNLYSNEIFDLLRNQGISGPLFSIVGVGTPDPQTLLTAPYVNLRADPVASLSGLPWTADNDDGCVLFGCHHFDTSYMEGVDSRQQILDRIYAVLPKKKLPVARDDTFTLRQGVTVTVPRSDILANDDVPTNEAVNIEYFSGGPTIVGSTFDGSLIVDLAMLPDFVGQLTLRDILSTPAGSSNVATITLNVTAAGPAPNQPPMAGFSMTAGSATALSGGTLNLSADSITGEAQVIFTDRSADADGSIVNWMWTVNSGCTPSDPPPCVLSTGLPTFTWGFKPGGPYVVTLTVIDNGQPTLSDVTSATINVASATNQPPVAGFRMTARGISRTERDVAGLTVFAAPNEAAAVSLSSPVCPRGLSTGGCSIDLDSPLGAGNISSWSWTIGGVAYAGPTLNVILPPGTYPVSLVVTDGQGSQSAAATSTISVSSWLFHEDADPLVGYGPLLVAPDGSIYAARTVYGFACGFGVCDNTLQKLAPDGTEAWTADTMSSDSLSPRTLAFGPAGRVYFQATTGWLHAFQSDGQAVPGWPVSFLEQNNSGVADNLSVDSDTGIVHFALDANFTYEATSAVALKPSGDEAWNSPVDSRGYEVFQGEEGDVYFYRANDIVRVDRTTGTEICRTGPFALLVFGSGVPVWGVGGEAGLFGDANHSQIYRLAGDCSLQLFYQSPGSYANAVAFDKGNGFPDDARLVLLEYGGGILQPTPANLVGLDLAGARKWVQDQIDVTAILAARGTTYVIGRDRADGLVKVFFLNTASGEILDRVDVSSLGGCALGVGAQGETYLWHRKPDRAAPLKSEARRQTAFSGVRRQISTSR